MIKNMRYVMQEASYIREHKADSVIALQGSVIKAQKQKETRLR